jgi:hypothetical protein
MRAAANNGQLRLLNSAGSPHTKSAPGNQRSPAAGVDKADLRQSADDLVAPAIAAWLKLALVNARNASLAPDSSHRLANLLDLTSQMRIAAGALIASPYRLLTFISRSQISVGVIPIPCHKRL